MTTFLTSYSLGNPLKNTENVEMYGKSVFERIDFKFFNQEDLVSIILFDTLWKLELVCTMFD